MCSGRVDLEFVLRAFSNGMDGVFIGGCRLNECNYITHGNFHALAMVHFFKKILDHFGLNPERLRIAFMSSGEGLHFTEVLNEFSNRVKELGSLGAGEGVDKEALGLKFEALERLIPYLRLVLSEQFNVHFKTEEGYQKFFQSHEADRLFHESVVEKLAISQILLLLNKKPHGTAEISQLLGLNPSEVSKHMILSSKQGFVRYDESRKQYAIA